MTKNFWNKKWGKNNICGISHTRLRPGKNKNGQSYAVFLPCKHGFYRSVLKEWVKMCQTDNKTCPICRSQFFYI